MRKFTLGGKIILNKWLEKCKVTMRVTCRSELTKFEKLRTNVIYHWRFFKVVFYFGFAFNQFMKNRYEADDTPKQTDEFMKPIILDEEGTIRGNSLCFRIYRSYSMKS